MYISRVFGCRVKENILSLRAVFVINISLGSAERESSANDDCVK